MNTPSFISSLHRPFNNRLKTCKWVCTFAKNYTGTNFKNDFFLYLVDFLYKSYQDYENIPGLPTKETIVALYHYISTHEDINKDLERFNDPTKKNVSKIDKKLFSNLKAVSYYITLAKNLNLLGSKHTLTEEGLTFAQLKDSPKHFMNLTQKEQIFLFTRILENDIIPFLFSINFYRLKKKYQPTDIERQEGDMKYLKLLDKFLNMREFKYKQSSWENYIKVRENWIVDLEILTQSHYGLKPNFMNIIELNPSWKVTFEEIFNIMKGLENSLFKTLDKYRNFKLNLYQAYIKIKKKLIFSNIGYVNLYDIKQELNISFIEFESMLNRLANDEINRKYLFFNNIIAAVDHRKRFNVKNTSVLNIRITKALK